MIPRVQGAVMAKFEDVTPEQYAAFIAGVLYVADLAIYCGEMDHNINLPEGLHEQSVRQGLAGFGDHVHNQIESTPPTPKEVCGILNDIKFTVTAINSPPGQA